MAAMAAEGAGDGGSATAGRFESALARRRARQNRQWMIRQFQNMVLRALQDDAELQKVEAALEVQLLAGHITPRAAAAKLFRQFKRR